MYTKCAYFNYIQECIPVGCVPPACYPYPIVSHVSRGDCPTPPPQADPPGCRPPGGRPPSYVTCDACWGANHHPLLPSPPPCTEGMINACENITLPQTSFAGGKNGDVINSDFEKYVTRAICSY